MRRADRILVSGVRIGRLFLLFSLPLLIALRYRPTLSEAESCTEKSNFPPQVIAAPSIEGTPPFVPRGGMGDGGVPHVSLSGVGGDILFSKENIPLTSCAASRHFLQQTAVFSAPFQFYPYNIYVIIQKVFNFGVSYERDQGKIFCGRYRRAVLRGRKVGLDRPSRRRGRGYEGRRVPPDSLRRGHRAAGGVRGPCGAPQLYV